MNTLRIETPAAKQFAAWLTAFNSGSRAAMLDYHDQHCPYEVVSADVAGIDREYALRQNTGGFVVKSLERSGATGVVAILKERHSDQFGRVSLDVLEASERHRVERFEIHPIPTPDAFLSPEERAARRLDAARRRTLIDRIAAQLEAHYVFPDKAEQMVARLRDRLARGEYDKLEDSKTFAETVTNDLRDVTHDLHLAIRFGRVPVVTKQRAAEDTRALNFGFGRIERLSGNIAHVVIHAFPDADDDESHSSIGALMSQLADADALLIDLRTNGGGNPATVARIASYLFDETPIHLNDIFRRDTGVTDQSWTLQTVPGRRFGSKKPVYVLTSKQTISGGEEFAYDLQALKRAKLIGETTAGAAHPMERRRLDDWFQIFVPYGCAINPITGTNWEGAGVVPDIAVAAEAALEAAHALALEDQKL